MKITAEELIEDVKKSFSTRDFRMPITGYSFDSHRTNCVINTRLGDIYPEHLAEIVNFYLDKASLKKSEEGEVTVTTNEAGECILVSRQDEHHKILKVIWEKK